MPCKSAAVRLRRGRKKAAEKEAFPIDNEETKKTLDPLTIKNYRGAVELWDSFMADNPEANLESFEWPKRFVDEIALGTEGKLGIEEPSMKTVLKLWKYFTAGRARDGQPVKPAVLKSTSNFIKNELRIERKLPLSKTARAFGTQNHLFHLMFQLWRNDWHMFQRPGARVELSAEILLNVFTAARVGEYIESSARVGSGRGLHFREAIFGVFRNERGEAEFIMEVEKDAKGMTNTPDQRPRQSLHEGSSARPLFCNPVLMHLAIFIGRDVFRDVHTVDEVLNIQPPEDGEVLQLHWKPEILDQPVYQRADGRIDTATTYCTRFHGLAKRAGYLAFKNHFLRRENLHSIDKLYSTAQRMRQAGHRDPRTYDQHYAPQNPGTDGQAAYLGDTPRALVNNLLRSMTLARNPELWQSLPAEKQHEVEQREDFCAIEDQLAMLALKGDEPGSREQRRKLNAQKRKIVKSELDKFQREQPNLAMTGTASKSSHHRSRYSRIAPLMPIRRQLSDGLFLAAEIRSKEGIAVLENLVALCRSTTEVSCRPGLEPEKCPCRNRFSKTTKSDAQCWRHVYSCYGKILRKEHGLAEFCFFCNEWFTDPQRWADHCEHHVEDPETLPIQCDPFIYGGCLATPGLCPWCLGNQSLPATVRMKQFPERSKWQNHVQGHIEQLKSLPFQAPACPHPREACDEEFESMQKLENHLQDVHCWIPPRPSLKRRSPDSDSPQSRKARKLSDASTLNGPSLKQELETATDWAALKQEPETATDWAARVRSEDQQSAISSSSVPSLSPSPVMSSRSLSSTVPSLSSTPPLISTPSPPPPDPTIPQNKDGSWMATFQSPSSLSHLPLQPMVEPTVCQPFVDTALYGDPAWGPFDAQDTFWAVDTQAPFDYAYGSWWGTDGAL